MLLLGLFVKMSNGATYAVVPFINKRALGSVSGIVGAGGNAAAVAAGFLFKSSVVSWPTALFILGGIVTLVSVSVLAIRFSPQMESEEATHPNLAGGEAAPVLPAGVQAV
jgi:NNP family nitrate/nitrite transporter-like MFS transporter